MRRFNPPFRWDAPALTKIMVSAVRVLDVDTHVRLELITPAHGSERVEKIIDVPFIPRILHADCISVDEHQKKMAKAVEAAVADAVASANARAQAAEERARQVEQGMEELSERTAERTKEEGIRAAELTKANEEMNRQVAAMSGVMEVVEQIDKLSLLFLHRPAFGQTLRQRLARYQQGNYPRFITDTDHEAAIAAAVANKEHSIEAAVKETVRRLRTALEVATRRLSEINQQFPQVEIENALKAIEHALIPFDGV